MNNENHVTPRKPESVTRKGVFTVRVYDEAAYRANIAQYYQEDDNNVDPDKDDNRTKKPARFPKEKKPSTRYNWLSGAPGIPRDPDKKGA